MTKEALAALLERIDDLPHEAREEIVRSITDIARRHRGVYRLDPNERKAIEEGLAQAERGEFVSDELLAEADRHHGL